MPPPVTFRAPRKTVSLSECVRSNDDYNTPQLATGVTYRFDANNAVTAKIMRNWRDGAPSSTGVSLGFTQRF